MSNQPKNHHYVPAFYLAGFTLGGTDQDRLYVLDKSLKKTWEASPKQAAKSNHFYRVELDGLDPTGIEKGLAAVEGECAEAIRNTVAAKAIPSGTDFDVLLNFVSLMSVRVPAIRNILSQFNDDVIKHLGMAAFSGPEGAKRLKHYAEQSGQTFTEEYIEQMQAFIQSNDYTADFDQNWHVEMMLHANDAVLQVLPHRNWSLWMVDDGLPDLICSDRPVHLMPRDPLPRGPMFAVGFGTKNTMLTMPLNRRMALASAFEDLPATYLMDEADVAFLNTMTTRLANQIYSPESEWTWTTDGTIKTASDYLQALRDGQPVG